MYGTSHQREYCERQQRRPALWVGILLSCLLAFTTKGQETKAQTIGLPLEITWVLVDQPCPQANIPCGEYGAFHVGNPSDVSTCSVRASATETPQSYPGAGPRQAVPQQIPGTPSTPTVSPFVFDRTGTVPNNDPEPPQVVDESIPCAADKIFTDPGGPSGAENWIAAMDWREGEHGVAVGALLEFMSGMPVHLLPLDDPDSDLILGETIGDGHVLAQACGLLDAIDFGNVIPPTVLNMSFGRLYDPDEDPVAKPCDKDTMSCQVVKVITRLANRHKVTPVAAAGNHKVDQFPAMINKVIDVGSLDLKAFTTIQESVSSWEMPANVSAHFPGSLICTPCENSEGRLVPWSPNPGSSYASAAFGGALARTLVDLDGSLDPWLQAWKPTWSSTKECFQLGPGIEANCLESVETVFSHIFGVSAHNCWQSTIQTPKLSIAVSAQQEVESPIKDMPSHIEWVSKHAPAPPPDICGACVDENENKAMPAVESLDFLILDLTGGSALASDQTLSALYLRTGDAFYELLSLANGDQEALGKLQDGFYKSLELRNAPPLPSNEQASIVSITAHDEQEDHWNSTPLSIVE